MRCYIAGPMRGYPLFNFPAFDAARDWLILLEWQPVSPADLDRQVGVTQFTAPDTMPENFIYDALRRDFMALCQCEAIVFLPGWESSSGAKAERFVAEQIGLKVFYMDPETGNLTAEEELVTEEV